MRHTCRCILRILHVALFTRYARVNERVETASQQKGKAQASALLSQMLALRSEVDRLKREQALPSLVI